MTRQMAGGKDGQALFHRILLATATGLTTTTVVEWQYRVQYLEYNISLTKNYCIIVSIQKISSIYILIQQISGVSWSKWPCPFLTTPTQNSVNFQLSWICSSMQKNQFIPSVHSWDTVNFRVLWPDWPHPFLTMSTLKFFDQLFICVNLYQQAKNQAISQICSGDMVD